MAVDLIIAITVSLVLAATSLILSELLRPKPDFENARPKGIDEFQFPTAQEDRVIPIVFGTVKITGPNVVWYGDFQQRALKETIKTGLWSKSKITTGFQYFFGFQMALCRGEWEGIRRIWIGESQVHSSPGFTQSGITINEPNLFGGNKNGTGGVQGALDSLPGTETQIANGYLANLLGTTIVPAYRGTSYVVWRGPSGTTAGSAFTFGNIGNSTQIRPWSFEVGRFPNTLGIAGGRERVNTLDANPVAVIYELLTNDEWGFAFDPATIDTTEFLTAADTIFFEDNGFSFLMDNPLEALAFLQELERQIDGLVFFDRTLGKWTINLTRGGYDIDLVPQIDSTVGTGNVEQVTDFTRGTWDETVNQVRVKFSDRKRDYESTFVMSPDLGNHRIQGGEVVSVQLNFPGVKDGDLAAEISARELKALSVPLAKAGVVVDRSLHALKPGEPVAYTDPVLGLVKFPMRVMGMDFGDLENNRIHLTLVQDVFEKATQIVAPPFDPLWVPPTQDVTAFPADQQIAFESPNALVVRDPEFPGIIDRIWGSGRLQTGLEVDFLFMQRNDTVAPTGAFTQSGEVDGFMLIGTLTADILKNRENPDTEPINFSNDLTISAGSSTIAEMTEALQRTAEPNATDVGQNLVHLIKIDDEFLALSDLSFGPTSINAGLFWSALLDSSQEFHAAGTNVYLIFAGGGLTDDTIPQTNNVDVQLRSRSRTDVITELEANTISLTMANRARSPYPPYAMHLNGERWANENPAGTPPPSSIGDVQLDTQRFGTTGLDDRGIEVVFHRRDWRLFDEIVNLGFSSPKAPGQAPPIVTDAETNSPFDFPNLDQTQYRIVVIEDPDGLSGGPNTLFTTDWNSGGNNIFISRTTILFNNAGVVPFVDQFTNVLRLEIETRHQVPSGNFLTAIQKLSHSFPTELSSLINDTNLGVLAPNTTSSSFQAFIAGTLNAEQGVAFGTGEVQVQINGGGFSTLISQGSTTGSVVVAVNDTIEVRHTEPSGGSGDHTFLELDLPGTNVDAYAILAF